jgi:hypothetical protein
MITEFGESEDLDGLQRGYRKHGELDVALLLGALKWVGEARRVPKGLPRGWRAGGRRLSRRLRGTTQR